MRAAARTLTLAFSLGLVLACPAKGPSEVTTPEPTESDAPQRPHVGDRAPAISLATLSGSRVTLPQSDADRAAILIFGSFS
ncbi:hypothetical protein ACNOYE_24795 [Nannocystaceae bacterium ST9]